MTTSTSLNARWQPSGDEGVRRQRPPHSGTLVGASEKRVGWDTNGGLDPALDALAGS